MALLRIIGVDDSTGQQKLQGDADTFLAPDYLTVGSPTTPASATGDLVAGDGTNSMTYDASVSQINNFRGSTSTPFGSGAFNWTGENDANRFVRGYHASSNGTNRSVGFEGCRAGGNLASPTAVLNGYDLVIMSGYGYDGSTFAIGGQLRFEPTTTWNGSTHNTRFSIATTSGTTLTERWSIEPTGEIRPWANNSYDIGTTGLRPRTLYLGTALNVGTGITPSADNGDIVAGDGTRLMFYDASGGALNLDTTTALTNLATNQVRVRQSHATSGVPAAGLGSIMFGSNLATNTGGANGVQTAALFATRWLDATDANARSETILLGQVGGGNYATMWRVHSLANSETTVTVGGVTTNPTTGLTQIGLTGNFVARNASDAVTIDLDGAGFARIGSTTAATALGDLAAGDGTREMLWDASANNLSLGVEATTTIIQGVDATADSTNGATLSILGGDGAATNADGGDVLIDGGALAGSGAVGEVRVGSLNNSPFIVGDTNGSSSGTGTGVYMGTVGSIAIFRRDAGTNDIVGAGGMTRRSTGSVAAGFGLSSAVVLDVSGVAQTVSAIQHYWHTVGTGPNRSGAMAFHVWNDSTGAGAGNPAMTILGDGSATPNQIVTAHEGFRVGSTATNPNAGDIVAGDGTNEFFWDASAGTLSLTGLTATADHLLVQGSFNNNLIGEFENLSNGNAAAAAVRCKNDSGNDIYMLVSGSGATLVGEGANQGSLSTNNMDLRVGPSTAEFDLRLISVGTTRWTLSGTTGSIGHLIGGVEAGSATLRGADAATAATAGANLTVRGGNATTSGAGGVLDLVAGTSPSGTRGVVTVDSLPLPTVLSETTTIDLDTVGDNLIYTVPTGRSALVLGVMLRVTAATTPGADAVVSVGINNPDYDNIIANNTLTGLDSTSESYMLTTGGVLATATTASTIYLRVSTADSGSNLQVTAYLIGFLI